MNKRNGAILVLVAVVAFAIAFAVLSFGGSPLLRSELRVDMSLSAPGGSFEVYVNRNFQKSHRIEETRAGRKIYIFSGLPVALRSVRLNPIDKQDIEITLHAIEILIGDETIASLPVRSLRTHFIEKRAGEGKFLSAGNDPTFVAELSEETASALEAAKQNRIVTRSILASLIAVGAFIALLFGNAILRAPKKVKAHAGADRRATIERQEQRGSGSLASAVYRFRIVFVLVLAGAFLSVSIFLLNTYRASQSYVPSYDMVVEARISALFGVGALYVNQNWDRPKRNSNAVRDGRYVFEYLPSRIAHLRLDLPTAVGARVEIESIQIRTSPRYRPHAGRVLLSFTPDEFANWQINSGQWLQKGRVFTADRRMVELHRARAIDLGALLPAPPELPLDLQARFWVGGIALFFVLAAGLYVVAVIAKRARNLLRRLAIVSTGGACWTLVLLSAYPAHWTWDQFYTLNELFAGKLSDLHPPLSVLSWVFAMDIARAVGFDKLGQIALLLFVLTAVFWAAAVYMALQFRHVLVGVAVLLAIALTPTTLSLLGDIGKDGQLMIAMFVAAVLLFRADKETSLTTLIVAIFALFYAYLVRTNAPAPALPLTLYAGFVFVRILKRRFGGILPRARGTWVVSGGVAALLFVSFFGGTILFYKATVDNPCCLGAPGAATSIHDLIGLTARTQKTLLPDYVLADQVAGGADIAQRYWAAPGSVDFTGLTTILPADQQKAVVRHWLRQIVAHPVAYWEHRLWVNKYFFGFTRERNTLTYFTGMSTPEYPWVTARSRELFAGLGNIPGQLTQAKSAIFGYMIALQDTGLTRLWVYVVVFLCALAFLPARFEDPLNRFSLAVAASTVCHLLPLVLLTSSASARYSSWPFLAIVVILFVRLDLSLSRERIPPATGPAWWVFANRLRRFPLGEGVHPIANFALWTVGFLGLGYWLSSLVPVG